MFVYHEMQYINRCRVGQRVLTWKYLRINEIVYQVFISTKAESKIHSF